MRRKQAVATGVSGAGREVEGERGVSEYFYIITCSWMNQFTANTRSMRGVAHLAAGQTEEQMMEIIYEETCRKWGNPDNPAVVFFYLKPNQPTARNAS